MWQTPCWSRRRVWGVRNRRDNLWWTIHNSHSSSPWTAQMGKSRFQTEVETRKQWGVGRICGFRFVLIFLLYYSVISWQENNPLLVMSVLPVTIIAEWSHCPYPSHELFALFSLLSCWEGGELVGTSWPAKVSSPYCSTLTGRQQDS